MLDMSILAGVAEGEDMVADDISIATETEMFWWLRGKRMGEFLLLILSLLSTGTLMQTSTLSRQGRKHYHDRQCIMRTCAKTCSFPLTERPKGAVRLKRPSIRADIPLPSTPSLSRVDFLSPLLLHISVYYVS